MRSQDDTVEKAHEALYAYFDEFYVEPGITKLYLEIMEQTFKTEGGDREKELRRLKEMLKTGTDKLSNLEEKWVMNEIEKDSYALMKPKFKKEISEFQARIAEFGDKEDDYFGYLKFGINLLSNLRFYYEKASTLEKQKILGSIFPENLIIENLKC